MKSTCKAALFLAVVVPAVGSFAQVNASAGKPAVISGTVRDEAGNPIPYANVFIASTGEGQVANEDGTFSFASSVSGSVELVCSAVGSQKFAKMIAIVGGRSYDIHIVLGEKPVLADNVDVTASSFSSEPGKGLTVTQMDIYMTPGGAADIFQSLKTLPGLTQVSESSELYVRGGDPSETLVLLDQATLYNPYAFESPHGGLFSNINTAAVGSMFFSSGGFSVKYGNALSGVLDLKTKGIPSAPSFQFGASLAGASAGIEIPALDDRLGVRIYARKNFTKPIFWLNGGSDRFAAMPSSQDADALLMYKYSRTGSVKLFLLASSDDGGVHVNRPELSAVFTGTSRTLSLNLENTELICNDLLIETSLSGSNYNDAWLLSLLDLNRIERVGKFRADMEYTRAADLRFSFGGEIEYREERYVGTIPAYNYDLQAGAASNALDATFSATRYGGYLQVEKTGLLSVPALFATAGVRGDYVGVIDVSWLDPRMTVGYSLNSASTVQFSAGLFHEYPDPRMYSPSDGNPHLLPMRAIHFVLGYEYKPSESTEFRIEAYEKSYSSLPDSNSVTNLDNSGYGYARGVDIILKGDLPFGLSGWVSYGWIDTKRKWYESEEMAPSPYDITNGFTFIVKYNITEAWQVGLDFKYATGMPYTPVAASVYLPELKVYQPIDGPSFSQRYPDYRRVDLRLTHMARLFGRYFTVFYLEGLNVLDIHNIFGYAYSPDYSTKTGVESFFGRRTVVVGMQLSFE